MQHFTANLPKSAKNGIFALLESGSYQQTRVLCPAVLILHIFSGEKKKIYLHLQTIILF